MYNRGAALLASCAGYRAEVPSPLCSVQRPELGKALVSGEAAFCRLHQNSRLWKAGRWRPSVPLVQPGYDWLCRAMLGVVALVAALVCTRGCWGRCGPVPGVLPVPARTPLSDLWQRLGCICGHSRGLLPLGLTDGEAVVAVNSYL